MRVDRVPRPQLLGQFHPPRVGVGDRDAAQRPALLHQLDPAPVGEPLYGELGELAQRLVGVERARQQLARLGQEREPLGRQPRGLVEPRPLERVSGLLHGGGEEGAILTVEAAAGDEAQRDGPEGDPVDRQRDRRQGGEPLGGADRRVAAGELARRHRPDRLVALDRIAHRRLRREREAIPAPEGALGVAGSPGEHHLLGPAVEQPDRAGVGTEPGDGLLEQDVDRALGGDLAGERGGQLLQARGQLQRPVPGGDVAGDHRGADDAPAGGVDRRDGEREHQHPPVLGHPLGLVVLEALAGQHPGEDPPLLPRPVPRDQDRDRLPDRLGRRVPVDPLGGRVPAGDDPLDVLAQDRVVGGFDDRGEALGSRPRVAAVTLLGHLQPAPARIASSALG